MDSLNRDNQADVIEAFNSTSRYLNDLLNIDNPYFEGMVNQIYPPELQLNKTNISDTGAPFLFFLKFMIFRVWMATFLVLLPMVNTFRNYLGLLESTIM